MKKTIIILLILFSACAVKAQTTSSPKIHMWVKEGESDYTIQGELWHRLEDSRLYNKLGKYSFNYKWDDVKEGDFIVLALQSYLQNINGNITTLTFCQAQYVNGYMDLIYKSSSATNNISDQHINQSVEACYKQILEWNDTFIK